MPLFKHWLVTALLLLCVWIPLSAQGRLVSVLGEQTLTLDQQLDSVIQEFGIDVRQQDLSRVSSLLRKFGTSVRVVAVSYRSADPLGNEVVASGLISFPTRGFLRGTVEMLPYNREKSLCGTRRLYTTEVLASALGYVTLVPDNIGYGTTDSLTVAYQMSENSALIASHLREAAQEFFTRQLRRKLPRKTTLFGYSLGAPNALALAYLYAGRKDIKLKAVCLGSGAYNPLMVLEHTLENGQINYLIYPGFMQSLNAWSQADLHPEKLFKGRVLEDFALVSGGTLSPKDMAQVYGTDVRNYLHPDFFTAEGNDDIDRLKEGLASLAIPQESKRPLPSSTKVVIRHSAADDIVPVSCSDQLVKQLRSIFHPVIYRRDRSGTHYETATRSFIDLALLLL